MGSTIGSGSRLSRLTIGALHKLASLAGTVPVGVTVIGLPEHGWVDLVDIDGGRVFVRVTREADGTSMLSLLALPALADGAPGPRGLRNTGWRVSFRLTRSEARGFTSRSTS